MSSNCQFADEWTAAITVFELDRPAVLAGEPVTVRWRTANAVALRITPPDGFWVDLDARSGSGTYRTVVRNSGIITATAWDAVGGSATASRAVAVFEMPETVEVPIPGLRETPMPVFGRTPIHIMERGSMAGMRNTPFSGVPGDPPARPTPPAWATPPVRFMSVSPVRSPERTTPPPVRSWFDLGGPDATPVDLSRIFRGRPRRWRFVERVRNRRRGAQP